MEDDVDELPDSDLFNYPDIVFNNIYNDKDGVLPFSNFIDLIETLEDSIHSE